MEDAQGWHGGESYPSGVLCLGPMGKRTTKGAGQTAAPARGRSAVATRARREKKAGRPDGEAFSIELARLFFDDKCTDVVLLDIRGLSQIADFLVIASGTSDRQMRSVIMHVEELGAKLGHQMVRSNCDDRSTWLLADFVDVIVHVFEPNTRAHYDLEMLWGDAKRPRWEREGQEVRNRAGLTVDDAVFEG